MLVAGAGALLLRAPGARDREALRLEPVHWLLLAAIAFALVSALLSGTLFSNSEFFRLFDRFGVAPFLMFAIAPLAFRTEAQRKIFLGVLVALGGYLGLTALFETVGPHALVFPRYITNPDLGYHVGRARGPFLEAEANGIALFICGTAAAVAATTWRGSALVKGLCWLVVCLCFAGCLFSLSRGVWLGAAVAILLTLLFFRPVRRTARSGADWDTAGRSAPDLACARTRCQRQRARERQEFPVGPGEPERCRPPHGRGQAAAGFRLGALHGCQPPLLLAGGGSPPDGGRGAELRLVPAGRGRPPTGQGRNARCRCTMPTSRTPPSWV